ncbi:MAG: HipA family kinase [Terriglobales bacterium]
METLVADAHLGPKRRGDGNQTASAPQIFLCGGRNFIVKMRGDHRADRTSVNEVVAWEVARLLDLPTANAAIIDVQEDLIAASPALAGGHPGLYFGSEEITGAFDLTARQASSGGAPPVRNIDKAASAVAFDSFVWNADRNNPGNILLAPCPGEPGTFEFVLIDHGHCLTGPTWRAEQLASLAGGQYRCPAHPFPRDAARSFPGGLDRTCAAIEHDVDAAVLGQVVAAIPHAWGLENAAPEAIAKFLAGRKKRVRSDGKALL